MAVFQLHNALDLDKIEECIEVLAFRNSPLYPSSDTIAYEHGEEVALEAMNYLWDNGYAWLVVKLLGRG